MASTFENPTFEEVRVVFIVIIVTDGLNYQYEAERTIRYRIDYSELQKQKELEAVSKDLVADHVSNLSLGYPLQVFTKSLVIIPAQLVKVIRVDVK